MIKHITAIQMLKMAYDESQTAIEFCNWYIRNKKVLEIHEQITHSRAYQKGVSDAIQDPDHTCKSGEYFKDNLKND